MINKDRNCKSCMHLEDTKCKKWKTNIPNIHSFNCASYEMKKEFENKGLVIFDRDTQELRYEYSSFRVADMEYPNYSTMELYTEGPDHFRFNYYYVLTDTNWQDGHLFNILGHLSVGRMIRDNKIGKGTYVDKPYWHWEFDDDINIQDGRVTINSHDEDGTVIRFDNLKNIIRLVESVEASGNPLAVPNNIKVQYIRSEKYNTLQK